MGKKVIKSYSRFSGGIADFNRESLVPDAFAFGRSVDVRTDPQNVSILPRTVKESGTTITDLPKWSDTVPSTVDTYIYGATGNIYKRTSAVVYSLLRSVANSHGNGMAYFADDDFIYYTLDTVIGRYGPLSGTPTFTDDFLGAQGGVPLNTNSLKLLSASSQYASRADTASLSITGDLSIEAQIDPITLPSVGNTMALVSKWDESGVLRSYKFDIATVSGYFGGGGDGALTISINTTDTPTDSACTGSSGSMSLSATNASFASGQIVFIHQTYGTGAGTWMRNTISGYTAGTITLTDALNSDYITGAQVLVLKQYTNVTVNTGITWTAKTYDGTVGGILAFIASGTVTITGTINANGTAGVTGDSTTSKGFAGGNGAGNGSRAERGGGTSLGNHPALVTGGGNNGNGGGGAQGYAGGTYPEASGAGGGNATAGSNGTIGGAQAIAGTGGSMAGSADLTSMVFGGGGGGGGNSGPNSAGSGGGGGGIVFVIGATTTITGSVTANGGAGGSSANSSLNTGGGGGAGGSILIKAQTATLGAALITATGGSGGSGAQSGGAGSTGRVHLDYYTSYTGTTSPTLDVNQDSTLVTNTSYQLRLLLSSTGSNSETLSRPVTLSTAIWQHVAVSWNSTTSTATFFVNAVSQGTSTGVLTAIHNNASTFQVGMSKDGTGSAANFYNGLIDEVRVWNTTKTDSDFLAGMNTQIATNSANLQAYYKMNGGVTDATANSNDLTTSGSPTFPTDVPFPSPTTRLDIDQSATTAGNTYTAPVTISENTTNRKTFTPAKDPQKSLAVLIAAKGTGDWTITIHDQYNNVLATATVVNASLNTGYYEFIFSNVWRPLTNFTNQYHFHITSTVADGTVTTTTASDLETVSFRTYFQFLVSDTDFHPVARMLNFLVFGNERYIAKWDSGLYYPNQIVMPAGWRVRCFGYWREYLAVGLWRGTTITDFDMGRIYFWDGISPTFNFFIDVPEGGINALLGSKGILNVWAGYQGEQLVYQGGDTASKIKKLPKITADKYVEIFPGAVTMWRSLLRFGVSGNSDSTEIQKGIYTYGSTNIKYPEILTYDYPISTGTLVGTSTKVGLTTVVNNRLLIGWQDNVSYGIDYVSAGNDVYPTATIEFLIEDGGEIWREKQANTIAANFKGLSSGQSISTKYKIDDDTNWTPNQDATSSSDVVSRQAIPNGRYHQVQIACDLATTVAASPTINGVTLEVDSNETSGRVG